MKFHRFIIGVHESYWRRLDSFDWLMVGISFICYAMAAGIAIRFALWDESMKLPVYSCIFIMHGLTIRWMLQNFIEKKDTMSKAFVAFAIAIGLWILT